MTQYQQEGDHERERGNASVSDLPDRVPDVVEQAITEHEAHATLGTCRLTNPCPTCRQRLAAKDQGIRICGPAEPTAGDRAIVDAFAQYLRGEITAEEFNAFTPE